MLFRSNTNSKSSSATATTTATVNVNAKDDDDDGSSDSGSTLTVNINLPKRFDFKLLANQSHHLHVNISISENKNSKQRALASLPSSPNAISRAGNSEQSHSFTFTAGHLHSSSSCGRIDELNKDWAKHDTKHNLHLSGWYFGKMDWQVIMDFSTA